MPQTNDTSEPTLHNNQFQIFNRRNNNDNAQCGDFEVGYDDFGILTSDPVDWLWKIYGAIRAITDQKNYVTNPMSGNAFPQEISIGKMDGKKVVENNTLSSIWLTKDKPKKRILCRGRYTPRYAYYTAVYCIFFALHLSLLHPSFTRISLLRLSLLYLSLLHLCRILLCCICLSCILHRCILLCCFFIWCIFLWCVFFCCIFLGCIFLCCFFFTFLDIPTLIKYCNCSLMLIKRKETLQMKMYKQTKKQTKRQTILKRSLANKPSKATY